MSSQCVVLLAVVACLVHHQVAARPVRKTLNFNMFVLNPQHQGSADRTILATDGVSRFGPILEYLVQRVQGMMSVRLPVEASYHTDEKVPDVSENEVDGVQAKMPGVVVRPSRAKPGTYDVEIDVVVDDGQPNKID
ncbi:uncharacterized protein LOC120626042 [Pararge aegeria]|nr:uncharacterized protein LOC120626042 [Pararge aegeria]